MWKSSTVAFRYGSSNWDRPIQFWLVAPRLDGCSVMAVFVATATPLTYSVPVVPDNVTARWDQAPTGNWVLALSCCSPLPVVIATLGPLPALTVRNMYAPVPAPKSNTRDHVVVAPGFTQAEMVKSDSPLTMPAGRFTNSLLPLSFTALPSLPGTRGPVAWPPPVSALVTGPEAHSSARIALRIASAIAVIFAALALLPSSLYSSAAVRASAYQ